jgi:hypothetical protein
VNKSFSSDGEDKQSRAFISWPRVAEPRSGAQTRPPGKITWLGLTEPGKLRDL